MKIKYSLDEAFAEVDALQQEENAALGDHIMKLTEELGEISESYLMLKGYKQPKTTNAKEEEHLAEEAVDALIVCMAILSSIKAPDEFIHATLKAKIQKWKTNFFESKQPSTNREIVANPIRENWNPDQGDPDDPLRWKGW